MIIIFDVDGTIVDSGKLMTEDIGDFLTDLKMKLKCELSIVGGGTYEKIKFQLSKYFYLFDYVFPECGSSGYYQDELIYQKEFLDYANRITLNNIIKEFLSQILKYDIMHVGHLIDKRSGLYYLSPTGMQANDKERNDFIEKDNQYNIREELITKLKAVDVNDEFDIVLGGYTGLAVLPKGWDKSQILNTIGEKKDILFFGDRTDPNGNDYPLFINPKVKGYSVTSYIDTLNKLKKLFPY